MKKGLIAFSIISLIVLSGITLAQMDSVDCSFCEWAKQVLKRLISIDDKICSEEPIVLQQQRHTAEGNAELEVYIFMRSPTWSNGTEKRDFILVFPDRVGELVSIDDIKLYGFFDATANLGDTCEISINDVLCLTQVKTQYQVDEYFYEDLPQSCVDALDFDELNEMEIMCPLINNNAYLQISKIFYDATWKSC